MSCQIHLSLLSPNKWPFSLDWLPANACLVGGAVRDALLNRQQDYLDLDFVLPEFAVEIAKKIANYYQAGFVVLDEQRRIARVVFAEGTVDFAQQEGESLEKDLQRRDFTINAIAYNPYQSELIDPLEGLKDLEKRVLRMVSPANLQDDPLRLLRAYRQAAQLNFTIDATTRKTIRTLSGLLEKIAAERIQRELSYLFSITQGSYWLAVAWEDGLLDFWFKNATAEKLQQLAMIEQSAKSLGKIEANIIQDTTDNCFVKSIQIAKLACLVSSIAEEAELELIKLKYSRLEIRAVITALKYLPQLQQITVPMSLREQYFFFLAVGFVFPVVVLLATAQGISQAILEPLIKRYLDPLDQIAHPQPLVTGHDLIKNLNITPSPLIGQMLTEIQIAHIEGRIHTVNDALNFAQLLLEKFRLLPSLNK